MSLPTQEDGAANNTVCAGDDGSSACSDEAIFVLGSSSKWRRDAVAEALALPPGASALSRKVVGRPMTVPPDIDEKAIRHPDPAALVHRIAEGKMEAVKHRLVQLAWEGVLRGGRSAPDDPAETRAFVRAAWNAWTGATAPTTYLYVLTSDQVAVFRGEVREKPTDAEQNRAFLRSYRHHTVQTVAASVMEACTFVARTDAAGVKRLTLSAVSTPAAHLVHEATVSFADIPDDVIECVIARGDSLICCGGFVVEDPDLSRCMTDCRPSLRAVQGLDQDVVLKLLRECDARSYGTAPLTATAAA